MIIRLNTASTVPIYVQLRNQIVTGIGRGELKVGEKLPTVRQLALDAGVNTMTVSKAYQQLRQEGYVITDRRSGVMVRQREAGVPVVPEETVKGLRLRLCELRLAGLSREEILQLCDKLCDEEVG